MRRTLAIVPLGRMRDADLPGWLRDALELATPVDARVLPSVELSDAWLEPDGSGRYASNRIVDAALDGWDARPRPDWTLALTDADLTAPGHPFVFGEATVGGPLALVSLARLASADAAVLRRRALKQALHEIGHLAGLGHCSDPDCVMFPSSDVRDTDRKLPRPCEICAAAYPAL